MLNRFERLNEEIKTKDKNVVVISILILAIQVGTESLSHSGRAVKQMSFEKVTKAETQAEKKGK